MTILADINRSIEVEGDEVVIRFAAGANILNHMIAKDRTLYVVDDVEVKLVDNNADRPYDRAVMMKIVAICRRENKFMTLESHMFNADAANSFVKISDEFGVVRHATVFQDKELMKKVTGGFLVGDSVTKSGSKAKKTIVGFTTNGGELVAKVIPFNSTAKSPSKESCKLNELILVER